MSIQPVNKAVEHLISSYDQYWKRIEKQSIFISYRTVKKGGVGGGGGGGRETLSQAVGRTGRSSAGV